MKPHTDDLLRTDLCRPRDTAWLDHALGPRLLRGHDQATVVLLARVHPWRTWTWCQVLFSRQMMKTAPTNLCWMA